MSVAEKDGIERRNGVNYIDSVTYQDLYRRWEQSNWSAMALDFTQDREGWAGLTEMQRRSGRWIYSMFFYGEDAVTDNLSPYIDAAPLEEQKYFLATQQVDEARHAVFFHRFFKEVLGAGDDIASGLASTTPELNWGYMQVFNRLDRMADELRRDHSLPKFAQAITLYHLIVEAAMAQPGQHFIEDYFVKEGTMPAFSEGMANVSRDEQRHIGFGVKVLADCIRETDECKAAIDEILREVFPWMPAVFALPNWDREYTRCYGYEIEDITAFGMRAVEMKWKAIGYPMTEWPADILPLDPTASPEERADRTVKLSMAGIIGEPGAPNPDSSPEIQSLFFDAVTRAADPSAVNGKPLTIQWRFSDAEPWFIRIDNGSTRHERGLAPDADVTLETSWRDWLEASTWGGDPRLSMLRRKIRPHGSPLALAKMGRVFAPPKEWPASPVARLRSRAGSAIARARG